MSADAHVGQRAVARRPMRARETKWAATAAHKLVRLGFSPNQISLLSAAFSCLAGVFLILSGTSEPGARVPLLLAAAALIPLRGLCNLLDGMMAIEGGRKTRSGEVFNDLPDRISDTVLLVSAGYSVPGGWAPELGWAAAVLAVTTAYVRMLGGSAGLPQDFCGPMAKQHRMGILMAACLLSALGADRGTMTMALAVISLGAVITVVRRTRRIVAQLESGGGASKWISR